MRVQNGKREELIRKRFGPACVARGQMDRRITIKFLPLLHYHHIVPQSLYLAHGQCYGFLHSKK